MKADHVLEVHPVYVVTGKDDHFTGRMGHEKVDVLANRIGRSFIPVKIAGTGTRRQDLDPPSPTGKIPGFSGSEMPHQRKRFILGQDPDIIEAGVHDIAEAEIDYPVKATERDCRFGPGLDQNIKSAANAAGQKENDCFIPIKS